MHIVTGGKIRNYETILTKSNPKLLRPDLVTIYIDTSEGTIEIRGIITNTLAEQLTAATQSMNTKKEAAEAAPIMLKNQAD